MNSAVNVAVIHCSRTGHVAEIAREIAETAEKAGAEVRLRPVGTGPDGSGTGGTGPHGGQAAAPADLLWADAVIMGSPTRFGNVAGELGLFLESLGDAWHKGLLADKVYSAFTATSSAHGGQETTLHALMTSFHHFGGILVPPGYTHPDKFADGNPYGTAHCTSGGTRPVDDTTRNAARVQAERVVRFARAVKAVRGDRAGRVDRAQRRGKEE